jgi:hypothetical protein
VRTNLPQLGKLLRAAVNGIELGAA